MQHVLKMPLPLPSQPLLPKQQQQAPEIMLSLAAAMSDPNWTAVDPEAPPRLASEDADPPAAVGTTVPRSAVTGETPVGHAALHPSQAVTPDTTSTAVAAPASDSSSCEVRPGEDEEQGFSQLPKEEDEQLSEGMASLLPALSSAAADQEDVQQSHPEGKPGFLAKTVFCAVFSPILVPVLAVGGCLQIHKALSVQRSLWNYSV